MNLEMVENWLKRGLQPLSQIGAAGVQLRRFQVGDEVAVRTAFELRDRELQRLRAALPALLERMRELPDPASAIRTLAENTIDLVDAQCLFELCTSATNLCATLAACGSDLAEPDQLAEITRVTLGAGQVEPIPDFSWLDDFRRVCSVLAPLKRSVGFAIGSASGAEISGVLRTQAACLENLRQARLARVKAARECGIPLPEDDAWLLARTELVGYDAGAFAAYVQVIEEKAHSLICTLKKTPQLLDLEAQVAQSERAVLEAQQALLAALSAQLRSVIAGLRAGIRWLALCDAHLRTLGFTASYEYCIPVIRSERIFEVTAARFLPLLELFDEDVMGPYTPLSLGAAPACTIVGSNMGGKSTAVLTCAFVALLVQRGLPVPAQAAQICLIDRLFVLAGGGEPRPYISHFGEEMLLLQSALSAGEGRALVILDEFCRTTGVGEGRALLAAIIAAFVQRENLVIAATHFDGLPQLLSLPQYRVGGLDGAVMYAAQASLPERMRALTMHLDRRLTPDNGEHRSSDAFRIAAALGVDQDVLANAQEMYHVG